LPDPGAYSYYFGAESTYWAKPIGFRDDRLEELLVQGRAATAIGDRKQIYHQVEKRLVDLSPWIFINWRETAQAFHQKVKGYKQLGGGLAELSPGIALPILWVE
jgi:peptide/nickel transport system substrate-binding protein